MNKKKILIVEDDANIAKLVHYNLEKAGFVCALAGDGRKALSIIAREKLDCIILDIMLPELDGLEVCKEIKGDPLKKNIPILMLTAKGEEVDRIVGLELGADDYIVKPFSPRELVLRVKAVLRRENMQEVDESMLQVDNLVIDVSKHSVTVNKREVELTPIEFNLLRLLVQRKGRVQSRDVLLNDVWSIDSYITTRTVDTHVKRLRQKLGKIGPNIKTVRGVGYKFATKEN
ncbi:MAG: response regulator transcription factor [Candidatus Omnitrophica bacterium]|nr:response regulator transcription factor [Candidatus Omnitrophota bacterium]